MLNQNQEKYDYDNPSLNQVNYMSVPTPMQQSQPVETVHQPQEDKVDFTNFLQKANHPIIVFFTLLFKAIAVVCFLILGLFTSSDALIFIIVVISCSFDFWFVKNVSGRLLVGLRWWNEVKEDGSEAWIFESDHEKKAGSIDATIFWGSLYISPAFWGVFLIIEMISFSLMWVLACLIALILSFTNTLGYYKCSGEQKKKITTFLTNKGQTGIINLLNYGAGINSSKGK